MINVNPKTVKKHDKCPVEVRHKEFKGRPFPVPGLYCACHGTWIKWLSDEDYDLIKEELHDTSH